MDWAVKRLEIDNRAIEYFEISGVDASLEKLIDDHIVKICYGDEDFSVEKAKKRIHDFISTDNVDRKIGAIAEFFIHLYLISNGMKQESAFGNLEESSFKKGFDGVYTDDIGEDWYVESKSGDSCSSNHEKKVKAAYNDIKDKFESKTPNDPWLNARNHIKVVDPSNKTLLEKFNALSDLYDKRVVLEIADYNIIPCGTIFDNRNLTYNIDEINTRILDCFSSKSARNLLVVCVTNRAMSEFEDYLGR